MGGLRNFCYCCHGIPQIKNPSHILIHDFDHVLLNLQTHRQGEVVDWDYTHYISNCRCSLTFVALLPLDARHS